MKTARHYITIMSLLTTSVAANAAALTSPDGKTAVTVACDNGVPTYTVEYNGTTVIMPSALGLNTNVGDFTRDLTLAKTGEIKNVTDNYRLYSTKKSEMHYEANAQTFTFTQNGKEVMAVTFQTSNDNVAFRYELLPQKDRLCCVINSEATSFLMPQGTTTFLCPQMGAMGGFARTAPSYETHYEADGQMGKNGWGNGYTFPCLFKAKGEYWTLISETGVDGTYCATHLEGKKDGLYQIAFPSEKENNGYGSTTVQAALPSVTPWRTITIGTTLKPIAETTITWDVLGNDTNHQHSDSEYKDAAMKYGRGSWSWIIKMDASCNFNTQKEYIDFSAAMGWESLLIDAKWDVQIGRDRIAELAKYGKSKGVNLYLWYNSNGKWNDAPMSPHNCMDTSHRRRAEMAWMRQAGIRGIKVDFFGGDKQCTMQLYEDILRDAKEFGLMVIFHGCTLPRGWERMYPSYASSEAVRASENLHFGQSECDREAMDATFFPFLRNTVGSMDFGGSTLNKYWNSNNSASSGGTHRVTSDVFALSTAILFQSPVQHFAMAPNNLTDAPAWAVDFMKRVPTTWDDIEFIDGYPGNFVIMARQSGGRWYVAGVNAMKEPCRTKVKLPMFAPGTRLRIYSDDASLKGSVREVKMGRKQEISVNIPYNGGLLIEAAE